MSADTLPTLRIRGGALERHGRWAQALLDGSLAQVAPRLREHGFTGVHVLFTDGIVDGSALAVLAPHFDLLLAEGGIRDAATCAAAVAAGASALIVASEAIDDPALRSWMMEPGNPPPMMAVANFLDPETQKRARVALARNWAGLVVDALPPDETRLMIETVAKWDAGLLVRMPTDAGMMTLSQFLPLDTPLLIDVELLIEMTPLVQK